MHVEEHSHQIYNSVSQKLVNLADFAKMFPKESNALRINRNGLSSPIEEVEQVRLREVIECPHIDHIDILDLLEHWGLLLEL